jgi:hypothetical protein
VRGRKPKLTFDIQGRIVALVRAGNYLETAAGVCGVHRTTLFRWLEKGEQQTRGKYHDFGHAVRQAQSECVARTLMVISKEAQNNWKAAAWYLERTARQGYGRQHNPGGREAAEQILAQLEKTLEPAKFADVLRCLQAPQESPPAKPPKQPTSIQQLLSALSSDGAEQQAQLHSNAGSDPDAPKGGV